MSAEVVSHSIALSQNEQFINDFKLYINLLKNAKSQLEEDEIIQSIFENDINNITSQQTESIILALKRLTDTSKKRYIDESLYQNNKDKIKYNSDLLMLNHKFFIEQIGRAHV